MSRHQKIDDTIQHLRNRYLKARLASLGAFKVGPVMSHICLRTQLATQFYPNPNTKGFQFLKLCSTLEVGPIILQLLDLCASTSTA